jgi:hypothetical protein
MEKAGADLLFIFALEVINQAKMIKTKDETVSEVRIALPVPFRGRICCNRDWSSRSRGNS